MNMQTLDYDGSAVISKKINQLLIENLAMPCTKEQAEADYKQFNKIIKRCMVDGEAPTEEEKAFMNSDHFATYHTNLKEIQSLRETLEKPLIKVPTRYLVTNEKLVSPSGFHYTDKVFVKPSFALATNDPDYQPNSNMTLYRYDMENLDGANER